MRRASGTGTASSPARSFPGTPRSSRRADPRPWSDRPGFHAVGHVPEHPLVPAGGAELAAHALLLGRGLLGTKLVDDRDDFADLSVELFAAVSVDPPLVPRVRRTAAEQELADLAVDHVARKHGTEAIDLGTGVVSSMT